MNKNDKLVFLVGATTIAVTAHKFFQFRKEQKEARVQAALNKLAELRAVIYAHDVVQEEIRRGRYLDRSFDDVKTDFEFHTIAALNTEQ